MLSGSDRSSRVSPPLVTSSSLSAVFGFGPAAPRIYASGLAGYPFDPFALGLHGAINYWVCFPPPTSPIVGFSPSFIFPLVSVILVGAFVVSFLVSCSAIHTAPLSWSLTVWVTTRAFLFLFPLIVEFGLTRCHCSGVYVVVGFFIFYCFGDSFLSPRWVFGSLVGHTDALTVGALPSSTPPAVARPVALCSKVRHAHRFRSTSNLTGLQFT